MPVSLAIIANSLGGGAGVLMVLVGLTPRRSPAGKHQGAHLRGRPSPIFDSPLTGAGPVRCKAMLADEPRISERWPLVLCRLPRGRPVEPELARARPASRRRRMGTRLLSVRGSVRKGNRRAPEWEGRTAFAREPPQRGRGEHRPAPSDGRRRSEDAGSASSPRRAFEGRMRSRACAAGGPDSDASAQELAVGAPARKGSSKARSERANATSRPPAEAQEPPRYADGSAGVSRSGRGDLIRPSRERRARPTRPGRTSRDEKADRPRAEGQRWVRSARRCRPFHPQNPIPRTFS
jgi:hypothetical protein